MRAPFAVIGIGNTQLGDDGFGPAALRLLASRWRWPEQVDLVDVGTAGHELVHQLLRRERAILLDAATGDAAGTLVQLDHAALLAVRPGAFSPHEPSIGDALQLALLTGALPREVSLIGLVPESIGMGDDLTRSACQACEDAAALVAERVRAWGVRIEPREGADREQSRRVLASGRRATTPTMTRIVWPNSGVAWPGREVA